MILRARSLAPFAAAAALAALWAGAWGCARFVDVQETKLLATTPLRRIAILPFRGDLYVKRARAGGGTIVTCLYDRRQFPDARVSERAFSEVTAIFQQKLVMRGGFDIVKPGDVAGLVARRRLDPNELSPPAFFGAIGEGLGVDAVLAGNVFRYDERHGGAYGAERPAAVTLDVHLIHARTGELLWSASYSETQQTLTENAGGIGTFVQRGARFLSANQLADWAAEQILERFPKPRAGASP
jgi:curli production assembly/transport component CsgG